MSETVQATPGAPLAWTDGTDTDVAAALVQLTGLVQSIYVRVAERHDLTPVQARLLCVLLAGPRGMAELARCFGVEKAALTGLMDRAERRGLARRSPVPGDRRALQVTLTDAGRRAAAAFHAEVGTELNRLLSPLPPRDREHLRSAMAGIIARCRKGQTVRDGDRVFETYWTTRRGVEAMDYSYALMDRTVYGRQEAWENSPPGWPQHCSNTRTSGGPPDWPPVSQWPGGRPIAQWSRLEAGRSDDLTVGP